MKKRKSYYQAIYDSDPHFEYVLEYKYKGSLFWNRIFNFFYWIQEILHRYLFCSGFGDEKKNQINSPLFEHLYERTECSEIKAFLKSHLKFYAPIISKSFDLIAVEY